MISTSPATCYWCSTLAPNALDQLAGDAGAPSGETMLMFVPDGWIAELADGRGRSLCPDCASDDEIVAYMSEIAETDDIIAELCERETRRAEPTADQRAADAEARLVFGVEPFDELDYGSLA